MVALGLKMAVLDLSLILFIKSELLCRRFTPLGNSKFVFIIIITLVFIISTITLRKEQRQSFADVPQTR